MSPVLRHSLGSLLFVTVMVGTAMAETTTQPPYQLLEKGDQVVRLHTQTGIVDICTKNGASLVCRLSADERMSLLKENQRLEAQIEELIVALAQDRSRLAGLKAKLAENRRTYPLFDTQAYARHFEAALDMAYETWRKGDVPSDIVIAS